MSFAGISLIRDGRLWPSPLATNDAGDASGHHMLVVEGYSRIKGDFPNGIHIRSRPFRVGGHVWFLQYYPNGSVGYADFISATLNLDQQVAMPVKARIRFSFVDQADEQETLCIPTDEAFDFPPRSRGNKCGLEFMRRDVFENSKYLKDDSFAFRCEIVITQGINAKGAAAAASPFVRVPPPDMHRHFTDLLMTSEGSDVTFKVGGETFDAHRCILAARSRVFKAELFGPMKEGAATAGIILVEDMEPQVFRAMLAFIYTDLEPVLEKKDDEQAMWLHLLAAADRYDLQRLKLMCEAKLCGFIDVNTTTTILAIAERHGCDGLKKTCYEFLGGPGNLKTVVATDGFDHLISSSPSVVKELITMLAP